MRGGAYFPPPPGRSLFPSPPGRSLLPSPSGEELISLPLRGRAGWGRLGPVGPEPRLGDLLGGATVGDALRPGALEQLAGGAAQLAAGDGEDGIEIGLQPLFQQAAKQKGG